MNLPVNVKRLSSEGSDVICQDLALFNPKAPYSPSYPEERSHWSVLSRLCPYGVPLNASLSHSISVRVCAIAFTKTSDGLLSERYPSPGFCFGIIRLHSRRWRLPQQIIEFLCTPLCFRKGTHMKTSNYFKDGSRETKDKAWHETSMCAPSWITPVPSAPSFMFKARVFQSKVEAKQSLTRLHKTFLAKYLAVEIESIGVFIHQRCLLDSQSPAAWRRRVWLYDRSPRHLRRLFHGQQMLTWNEVEVSQNWTGLHVMRIRKC